MGDEKSALQAKIDFGPSGLVEGFRSTFGNLDRERLGELRAATKEYEQQRKRIEEIGTQLEKAKVGEVAAIAGPTSAPVVPPQAVDDVDELREKLAKLREEQEQELGKSFLSEAGREVDEVNKKLKEQLEILDKLIAAEPPETDGFDSDAVNSLVAQKVEAERRAQALITNIQTEAGKKRTEDEKKRAKEQAATQASQREFLLQQLKQLAELEGDTAGAKDLDKRIKGIELDRQLDATYGDDDAAKKRARALQRKIDDAADIPQKQFQSQGIFNAAAIQSLAGGAPLDKLVQSNAAIEKNTKKLVDKKAPAYG
jgi:hypothetical protein